MYAYALVRRQSIYNHGMRDNANLLVWPVCGILFPVRCANVRAHNGPYLPRVSSSAQALVALFSSFSLVQLSVVIFFFHGDIRKWYM